MECLVMAKRKTVYDYNIPFEIWMKLKQLLPLPKPKKKSGRPRKDDKRILSGIFYVLRTRLPMEIAAKILWGSKHRP
jgi:transposase